MPTLYNSQTKKWETVPDEQVEQAIKSGMFSFPKSYSNIPMYDLDGNRVRVKADDAYNALQNLGYTYRTSLMKEQEGQADIQEAVKERLSDPSAMLAAGATSFMSSLTGSGSDWLMRGTMSPEMIEEARLLKDLNPYSSGVGEILGLVTGAFTGVPMVTGPLKAAATLGYGGAKLGSYLPAKYGLKKAGSWLGQRAVEGATADALYEAGRISQDLALKDPNVTLQNSLGRLGTAALTGSAFDVGLGALGKSISGIRRGLEKGTDKFRNSVQQNPKVAMNIAKAYAFGRGWSDDQVQVFADLIQNPAKAKKAVDTLQKPTEVYDKAYDAFSDLRQAVDDIAIDLTAVRNAAKKPENFKKPNVELKDLAQAAIKIQDGIDNALKVVKKRPAAYGADIRAKADEILESTKRNIAKARTSEELFDAVLEGRNYADTVRRESAPRSEARKLFANIYHVYKNTLNNTDIFGNYGKIFGDYNQPISNLLSKRDSLFGPKGSLTTSTEAFGAPRIIIDDNRVKSVVQSPEMNAKNRKTWKMLQEMQYNVDALLKKANEPLDAVADPGLAEFRQRINENAAKFARAKEVVDEIQDLRNGILLINAAETKTGKILQSGVLGFAGGALASTVTGIPGLGAGAAAISTILSNPMTTLKIMSGMDGNSLAFLRSVEKGVNKFFKNPTVKKYGTVIKQQAASEFVEQFDDGLTEKKKNSLQQAIALVNRYNEDPELAVQVADNAFLGSDAPELDDLRTSAANMIQNGMSLLASKLPSQSLMDQMMGGDIKLNYIQEQEFKRYLDAFMNPGTIIKQLEEGTLDYQTVEVVKNVYPELYDTVRYEVIKQIADEGPEVSYDKKLQLGLLFDVAFTDDMKSIATLQEYNSYFQELEPEANISQAPLPTQSELTRAQELGA